MRPELRCVLWLALAACKTGSADGGAGDTLTIHRAPPADEEPPPSYSAAELARVLAAERDAVAKADAASQAAEASDYDQLRELRADLAVRRRFLATLEVCEAQHRLCPPRLDEPAWTYAVDADTDPKLDTALRFDLASWRLVAAELHGRACACRTLSCVDSVGAAIDRLEQRPMPEVQDDDAASVSVTRARECLYRLRGRRAVPRVARD